MAGSRRPRPSAANAVDRAAKVVLLIASVWFFFASTWGLFGILGDGHLGAGVAGNAICGEQAFHWKILYPSMDWYTTVPPAKSSYYCHHPFGEHYVPGFLAWLFGHRDFVVRLPEAVMSAALPPLLYGVAKERWGAPVGAVAAAAYVVVPIAVGFAFYLNLETLCIFGGLLFFWGHSRHMSTGEERYLLVSLVGMVVVCFGDWVGYLIVAPTLAWAFLRVFVLPARWTPPFDARPYARWWALSVFVFFVTLFGWVALFYRADAIRDWLSSAASRGGSEGAPLHATLVARKAWIYFSFTPLAIRVGIVAVPFCVVRFLAARTDEETYAPAMLFAAVVQYVKFKGGADVHIFWPHYFAPYYALALAEVADVVGGSVGFFMRRISPSRTKFAAGATALAVGLAPTIAMAHDGVKSLWVWRRTGGRYDDNGALIESRVDFLYLLGSVVPTAKKAGETIDVHPSVGWYWDHAWRFNGNDNSEMRPLAAAGNAVATHPYWVARPRGLSAEETRKIAASAHVRVYGDAWVVDQRESAAPLDAYSLNEREPNPIEWYVFGGTERLRSVGAAPDPWETWEWRTHVGQAAPLPPGEPQTLDQVRIAYNVAVSSADTGAAAALRARIEAALDRTRAADFDRGVKLLGVRLLGGVEPRVESWFECTGPMNESAFNVRSTVEAREPFSLIPPDPVDREMAFPPRMSTKLWQKGMVYTTVAVLNHRIGIERYSGYWASRDGGPVPRRADGKAETTLALVP